MLLGTIALIISVAIIGIAMMIVMSCGINIGILTFMIPTIIVWVWLTRFSIRKLDYASSEETQNIGSGSIWKKLFVNTVMIVLIYAIAIIIAVFCVIAAQINVKKANWHSEAVLLLSIFAAIMIPLRYLFRKMRNMRKALKSQKGANRVNFRMVNTPPGSEVGNRTELLLYEKPSRTAQSSQQTEKIDPVTLEPYEYEKYVAKYLISHGYKNASVTQQSGDYGVDVLAVNADGWRTAIQCKRYQGSVGVSAIQEIITGKEYYGCDLAAVYTTGSYTQQAIELARKVHVKLYILDKDGLRTAN